MKKQLKAISEAKTLEGLIPPLLYVLAECRSGVRVVEVPVPVVVPEPEPVDPVLEEKKESLEDKIVGILGQSLTKPQLIAALKEIVE